MIKYQLQHKKLRRNHSNASPRCIVCLSVETKATDLNDMGTRFSLSYRIGTAVVIKLREHGEISQSQFLLPDIESVWQLLLNVTRSNYTTWVISHGMLASWIVSGMPDKFEQGELSIDWPRAKRNRDDNLEDNPHVNSLCIIESPPTIIACRVGKTQGRVVFVDLMNWFDTSMAEIGQRCGLERLPNADASISDQVASQHSLRDSHIIAKSFIGLIEWVRENNLGMFRYTIASQAMAAFRHRFMQQQIYFHDSEQVKSLERKSYFGGRTEVFKHGKIQQRVHQLDVSSLFPSVMLKNAFPIALNRFEIVDGVQDRSLDIEWANSIAYVLLQTSDPIFPVRVGGVVVYPVGEFCTTLVGPELAAAHSLGAICKIGSFAEYSTKDIFSLFVSELWEMRRSYKLSDNQLYAELTKRIMNALYGKFGQMCADWKTLPDVYSGLPWSSWAEINAVTGERSLYRSFGWNTQKKMDRAEIEGTFPAISSFVSSYARIEMNRIRHVAGHENVYYQGVDCLIVNDDGLDLLLNAGEVCDNVLGKLRLQTTADECRISGCCDYRIGDKVVLSGRSLDNYENDLGETYVKRTIVADRLFSNQPIRDVLEEHSRWQSRNVYSKGTIGDDGLVSPRVLSESLASS